MMKKHIQEIVLLCLVPVLKKLRLKVFVCVCAVFQLHLKNLRELASLHTKCHELCLHSLLIALWGFLHGKPSSSWTVWVALLVYNNSKLLAFCELIETVVTWNNGMIFLKMRVSAKNTEKDAFSDSGNAESVLGCWKRKDHSWPLQEVNFWK